MKKILISLLLLTNTALANVKSVNDLTFKEEVLNASACGTTVIVDVYADWCGFCKEFEPLFEKASKDPANSKIKFVKIDADKNSLPANIKYLPTVIMYRNGLPIEFSGPFDNKAAFQRWINNNK